MQLELASGLLVLTAGEEVAILDANGDNKRLVSIFATVAVLERSEEKRQQRGLRVLQTQAVAIEVRGELLDANQELQEV